MTGFLHLYSQEWILGRKRFEIRFDTRWRWNEDLGYMKANLLSLVSFTFIVSILSVSANAAGILDRRHIQVNGSCTTQVVPDRAASTLSSEFKEKDVASASKKATETYERVREAIKALNLKDLELSTQHYQVSEWDEWQKNSRVHLGYRVSIGLRVSTSEVSRMGEVFAIAAREKLKDVGHLSLFLSNEKREKEHLECLKKAAADSRVKAEKLASGLGISLGSVLQVQEQYANITSPMANVMRGKMMMEDAAAGGRPAGVESGTVDFQVQVSTWFEAK